MQDLKTYIQENLNKGYTLEQIKKALIDWGYDPIKIVDLIEEFKDPTTKLMEENEQKLIFINSDIKIIQADIERLKDNIEDFKKDIDLKFHINREQTNEVISDLNRRKLNGWKFRRQEPLLLNL